MCHVSPEIIEAVGEAVKGVVAAVGAIVATVTSAVAAYYTYKSRARVNSLTNDIEAINCVINPDQAKRVNSPGLIGAPNAEIRKGPEIYP